VYPLLRFGTGDLSQLDLSPCACGRTTPRLTGILGRVGDGVKVRGLFVHPSQARAVFAQFPQVQRWRLVVTREEHRDWLVAEVEATADVSGLEAALREGIKVRTTVRVVPTGTIPADAPPIEDRRDWK
jgi:phenylacetate-CoA ligase